MLRLLRSLLLVFLVILCLVMALLIYNDYAASKVQVMPLDWQGFDSADSIPCP